MALSLRPVNQAEVRKPMVQHIAELDACLVVARSGLLVRMHLTTLSTARGLLNWMF